MGRATLIIALLLLLLAGCSEKSIIAQPSLSAKERLALSKKILKQERKKELKRRKQEQKLWLSSQGSNWPCPSLKEATRRAQAGNIAFAIRCEKGVLGHRERVLFPSASSSKALLLIAFLRSGGDVGAYRDTLESMVRYSDNEAADTIYYLLGDATLAKVAKNLGLKDTQFIGYWASILFSPADYARLFASLPEAAPKEHRRFAMRLFRSITPEQRWGIPKASAGKFYFKGGWRPQSSGWLVVQGALVKRGSKRVSLAIFTLGLSQIEAEETIKEIAKELI